MDSQLLKEIVANMPLAYAVLETQRDNNVIRDFIVYEANHAFLSFFDDSFKKEVKGSRVRALLKHFDMEEHKIFDSLLKTIEDKENHIKDIHLSKIDRYLELKFTRISENHLVVYMMDITEKMSVELLKNELEENHAILRTALDSTPDMVAVKDLNGKYLMVNNAVNTHYANRFNTIEGKTIEEVYPDQEIPKVKELDQEAIKNGKAIRKKVSVFTDDETYVVSDITRSPIYNHENQLIGLISVGRDISEEEENRKALEKKHEELQRLTEKFKQLSYKDDLTKLDNRRKFYRDIKSLDVNKLYSLILLDLNNFKSVNDDYGHNYGDKTLTDYAHFIEELISEYGGFAYRIGGDEFAIVVDNDNGFVIEDHLDYINRFLANYHENLSLAYGQTIIDSKSKKNSVYLDVTLKSADRLLYDFKNKINDD